jgi:cytochrome c nitrite reductase small subunit
MNWKNLFNTDKRALFGTGTLCGIIIAVVTASVYTASGSSYLCGSCHSMEHAYKRWQVSPHKQFSCPDCHLPATHLPGKLAYKSHAGSHDLVYETMRIYPAAILLSTEGREITNGNCVRCHSSTIEKTRMAETPVDCTKCHRFLVHGRGLEKGGISVE